MWRKFWNFLSYLWYVLTLDYFQLVSTVIDVLILGWSVFNWSEIANQPTYLLIFLGILINFVWQVFNVTSHFLFIKRVKKGEPLESMITATDKGKDFGLINVNAYLLDASKPFYYTIDPVMGVLRNEDVDSVLRQESNISLSFAPDKEERTSEYVHEYKQTLLMFLNQKWHDVNHDGGKFTNDRKICFASELYEEEGKLSWRITKGCYYNGYLTNFIFTKYIGGSHYQLYPPMSVNNGAEIKLLSDSDFSDHIGVSTLLYTLDDEVIIFKQAASAGYNSSRFMPSGSGSLDLKDYCKGDNLCSLIIKGAERELKEESSIGKRKKAREMAAKGITISTTVLCYYRDMERGGKPEFCCISKINRKKESISQYFIPEKKEMAKDVREWVKVLKNEDEWADKILPKASLSLKMNYEALKKYLLEQEV